VQKYINKWVAEKFFKGFLVSCKNEARLFYFFIFSLGA
jgi:hypothetical protein